MKNQIINIEYITSRVRRAVQEYDMINEGDKIAIGLSGGKDSQTLLIAFKHLKDILKINFDVHAVTLTLGHDSFNPDSLKELCASLNISY